jgi:nitroreductase
MLNDLSTPLSLLETRRSGKAREMAAPGPSEAQLEQMLRIAARSPDHGKITPWRFVVVGQDQRHELALLFRRALAANEPDATSAHHAKANEFAHQGEALVVLLSAPVEDHKIPVWEQQLSCGAVAMNLLSAAHALGFVGAWLTGWYSYDPMVREGFCIGNERIAGFFFFGSPTLPLAERPRPELEGVVRRWRAPSIPVLT